MEHLRLDIAGDFESVRQEVGDGHGRFLHFPRLDPTVRQGHRPNDFAMKLIRNAEDRTDDVLVLAPGGRDVADGFIPAREPIAQDALDHGQRNQQEQDEGAHTERA